MTRSSPVTRYIEGRSGWRIFLFSLAVAIVTGLGFRVYFSPERVKSWIEEAVAEHRTGATLKFQSARLVWARGWLPELAVLVSGVEAAPPQSCASPIHIESLRFPLGVFALFSGHLKLGTVAADGVAVDLDLLKQRCPGGATGKSARRPETPPVKAPDARRPAAATTSVPGWWTDAQWVSVTDVVGGFEFSRVELFFENHSKKIELASFLVEPGAERASVHFQSELVIPPALTYGEKLPTLKISGVGRPNGAQVTLRAGLSEGNLLGTAALEPIPDNSVKIAIEASVENVPVSTLVPLITKSGLASETFQPKFMWMNCAASIAGRFQGLFTENELRLKGCRIEGAGVHLAIESAVRNPNGDWQPMTMRFHDLELKRLAETFQRRGPDGVLSDFGRATGEVEIAAANEVRVRARLENVQVPFSNRSQRAVQTVRSVRFAATAAAGAAGPARWNAKLDEFKLDGGALDGAIEARVSDSGRDVSLSFRIASLRLSEAVERVLVGGAFGQLKGESEARFRAGELQELKGRLALTGLAGEDLRLPAGVEAQLLAERSAADGAVRLTLRARELELRDDSWLMQTLKPAFFAHAFPAPWIAARDVVARALVPPTGGLKWEPAQAEFIDGKARMVSAGGVAPDRSLSGWVSLDYPSVKKLKWDLAGTIESPSLQEASGAFDSLKDTPVDDAKLGLVGN